MAFTKFQKTESTKVVPAKEAAKLATALHSDEEDEVKAQKVAKILDES